MPARCCFAALQQGDAVVIHPDTGGPAHKPQASACSQTDRQQPAAALACRAQQPRILRRPTVRDGAVTWRVRWSVTRWCSAAATWRGAEGARRAPREAPPAAALAPARVGSTLGL